DDIGARIDVQRRGTEVVRDPAHDRVDRSPVGRGDVDALVEREEAGPVEPAGEDAVLEHSAWIAEEAPNRVLLVERLERPRIGRRAARDGERRREQDEYESERAQHGDPTMMGRAQDATVSARR